MVEQKPTFWSTLNVWDYITFVILGLSAVLCVVLTIVLHSKWTTPAIFITGGAVPALFIAGFVFVAWSRWTRYQGILAGVKSPTLGLIIHTSSETAAWLTPADFEAWVKDVAAMLVLLPNRSIVAGLVSEDLLQKWTYTNMLNLAKKVTVKLYDKEYIEYYDGLGHTLKANELAYPSNLIEIATHPKELDGKCSKVLCKARVQSLFEHAYTHLVYYSFNIGLDAATSHALMKQMNLPF
jgi:hypothetical protein